ncbi:MAG: hypothetical protein JO001_28925 [Alphaproteobacteria bacterium]|nr:hypothetical protein [Alphaproteobacteria bacterium]
MLVADYRRHPDDANTAVPRVVVVEPWSGFVFLYDADEEDEPLPPPPRDRGRRARSLSLLERWLGLAGSALAAR